MRKPLVHKLSLIIITTLVAAQGFPKPASVLEKADKAFANGHYYDAIALYRKAYPFITAKHIKELKQAKAEVMFKIGECYRQINNPAMEIKWYTKAINKGYKDSMTAVANIKAAEQQKEKLEDTTHYSFNKNIRYLKPLFDTAKVKTLCDEKRNFRKGTFVICLDTDYTPVPNIHMQYSRSNSTGFLSTDDVYSKTDGSGTNIFGRKFFIGKKWLYCSKGYWTIYHYSTPLGDNYVCMHAVKNPNKTGAGIAIIATPKAPIEPVKKGVRIVMHKSANTSADGQ